MISFLGIICLYSPVFYVLNYKLGEGAEGVIRIMAYVYGETPPEMGYLFRLQVYDAVGILLNEVYESVGKSVISVCKNAQND